MFSASSGATTYFSSSSKLYAILRWSWCTYVPCRVLWTSFQPTWALWVHDAYARACTATESWGRVWWSCGTDRSRLSRSTCTWNRCRSSKSSRLLEHHTCVRHAPVNVKSNFRRCWLDERKENLYPGKHQTSKEDWFNHNDSYQFKAIHHLVEKVEVSQGLCHKWVLFPYEDCDRAAYKLPHNGIKKTYAPPSIQ